MLSLQCQKGFTRKAHAPAKFCTVLYLWAALPQQSTSCSKLCVLCSQARLCIFPESTTTLRSCVTACCDVRAAHDVYRRLVQDWHVLARRS